MPWYYAIAERDHDIQNPTSAEKILLLGDYVRLSAESCNEQCGTQAYLEALLIDRRGNCRLLRREAKP